MAAIPTIALAWAAGRKFGRPRHPLRGAKCWMTGYDLFWSRVFGAQLLGATSGRGEDPVVAEGGSPSELYAREPCF